MLRILQGDALEQLRTLPAQLVQCCITSPPYWGLRDYGTAQWEGGEDGCEHSFIPDAGMTSQRQRRSYQQGHPHRDCKCGARRIDAQLGLEATPEEYITKMVAVFREVGRVLRDDGTCWINLGDSYASSGIANLDVSTSANLSRHGDKRCNPKMNGQAKGRAPTPAGLKPKDLCMMPARVAMALQSDGWYLRSDIIWHKPNPMPESVTDRPTKAHEYIFLLTKQERYQYDAEAIREPQVEPDRKGKTEWGKVGDSNGMSHYANRDNQREYNPLGRNKRSVWTIATQPYAEAHFATFPEEIPKLCILAGSKPGDTILDPFGGSGTVAKVALELGRKAILIELNPKYVQMIEDRTRITIGMF